MNPFFTWLSTGFYHVLDFGAYDHILFITLLALAFPSKQWKPLLILVTAFTLGHSLSLALSVMLQLVLPSGLIEFLIALSILLTAAYELLQRKEPEISALKWLYALTAGFGLIHGLGFSFLLRSLLGHQEHVFLPLLYFNLGLELGQLIIVTSLVLFSLFLNLVLNQKFKFFKLLVLCLIAFIALQISVERFLLLF